MQATMTVHQLHEILAELDDTRELVLESAAPEADEDPLFLAWRVAERRAGEALERWRGTGGCDAFAAYRALADQAAAAQDALAVTPARAA
jgi:hypothetical protein